MEELISVLEEGKSVLEKLNGGAKTTPEILQALERTGKALFFLENSQEFRANLSRYAHDGYGPNTGSAIVACAGLCSRIKEAQIEILDCFTIDKALKKVETILTTVRAVDKYIKTGKMPE